MPLFRAKLIETGVATEDQLAGIEADIERQIEEAVQFALNSDIPSADEITRDVYAD